jgi:hypothetical protein
LVRPVTIMIPVAKWPSAARRRRLSGDKMLPPSDQQQSVSKKFNYQVGPTILSVIASDRSPLLLRCREISC